MKLKTKPEDFKVREVPNLTLVPKGAYFIYLLKKKNRNTENAVQEISRKLDIPRKNIGYCGAKDRNAVTEQYISIINAAKNNVESLEIENVELEYVGRSPSPLSLGDHLGNDFEIIARECKKAPRKKKKIINYFGEQRFSKNNEKVGKAIVKGNFEQASNLIIEAGGWNARTVKAHLEKHPNDYVGALKRLPFKIANLYVHAYQSHLWNQVAKRVADNRNKEIPLVGFGTEFRDEEIKDLYTEILEKEGVKKKDFVIRQWPELSAEGAERKLYVDVKNLEIEELDEETYKLKFYLPKGAYATQAIKQFFQ